MIKLKDLLKENKWKVHNRNYLRWGNDDKLQTIPKYAQGTSLAFKIKGRTFKVHWEYSSSKFGSDEWIEATDGRESPRFRKMGELVKWLNKHKATFIGTVKK